MRQGKAAARDEMMHHLDAWQDKLKHDWVDKSLPKDWDALEHRDPR